jgi:hypothetical protein
VGRQVDPSTRLVLPGYSLGSNGSAVNVSWLLAEGTFRDAKVRGIRTEAGMMTRGDSAPDRRRPHAQREGEGATR